MTGQDPEIIEPERSTPVIADVEVVVVGGGPAGPMAAAAVGRTGRSAPLVDGVFLGPVGPDSSFLTAAGDIAKLSS